MRLSRSGTHKMSKESLLKKLESTLDRNEAIDSLPMLISSIASSPLEFETIRQAAFGIDTNVIMKLGSHRKSSDILDYLSLEHTYPLILPGQSIQEFWNNHLHAINTQAESIKRKFEDLKKATQLTNLDFSGYEERFSQLVSEFENDYGYVYDENSKRAASRVFDAIKTKASVPYVPRSRFINLAANRKRTKTPPGFKDDLDGDFYIWLDFLHGLQLAREEGSDFDRAILITEDKKIDWSHLGMAHPILSAEVMSLFGVRFETWSIEKLADGIKKELESRES